MKKVVVAGGGVLGSQIAFQTAYCGFDVTVWLRSEESIGRTKPKLDNLKETYIKEIENMSKLVNNEPTENKVWCMGIADGDNFNKEECLKKVEDAYNNLKIELDMQKALEGADLVIESMAEDLEEKKAFYTKMKPFLEEKTVVVSNSSTLLPSKMAASTGRPEKFLSLHFANSIWKNNTAEVMVHSKTDMKYFEELLKFAEEIRMVPLPLKKEKNGYLLNSMLIPLLFSAMDLYVNGISDPVSIDTAWKRGTGAPNGPFEILDVVGLTTAHNIVKMYLKIPAFMAPYNFKGIYKVLGEYIEQGKLGKASGEGFYKYEK